MGSLIPNQVLRKVTAFSSNPNVLSGVTRQFKESVVELFSNRDAEFFGDLLIYEHEQIFEKYHVNKKLLIYIYIVYPEPFIYWIHETNRQFVYIGLYESALDADLTDDVRYTHKIINANFFKLPIQYLLNYGHKSLVLSVINKYQEQLKTTMLYGDDGYNLASGNTSLFEILNKLVQISEYQYIIADVGFSSSHNRNGDYFDDLFKCMKTGFYDVLYGVKVMETPCICDIECFLNAYKERKENSPLTVEKTVQMIDRVITTSFRPLVYAIADITDWNQNIADLMYFMISKLVYAIMDITDWNQNIGDLMYFTISKLTTLGIEDNIVNHGGEYIDYDDGGGEKYGEGTEITSRGVLDIFIKCISGASEVSYEEVEKVTLLLLKFMNNDTNSYEEYLHYGEYFNIKGIFPHTEKVIIYLLEKDILTVNHGVQLLVLFGFHETLKSYIKESTSTGDNDYYVDADLTHVLVTEEDALKTLAIVEENGILDRYEITVQLQTIALKFYYGSLIKPLSKTKHGMRVYGFYHKWIQTERYNRFMIEYYTVLSFKIYIDSPATAFLFLWIKDVQEKITKPDAYSLPALYLYYRSEGVTNEHEAPFSFRRSILDIVNPSNS
jgi:hypothetical protein